MGAEDYAHQHRFLAAPDSFKGTFSSIAVADAIARGIRAAGGEVDACPLADGGEGTAAVLVAAGGGKLIGAGVHDPLGRSIEADFGLIANGDTAIVESAAASGLALVTPDERDPERATTSGTGELIAAAVDAGARRVLVAAGGSATTDGGEGAIAAIEAAGGLRGVELGVLCDVRTPFEQAAAVFGPQKGADAATVRRLRDRLDAVAERLPQDPRGLPLTGCAGGLSGGLWARFDATLLPGASFVLDAVGFDARMRAAAAVVTGEGRIDPQTLAGKLIGEIADRCRAAARPLHAVVGADDLGPRAARAAGLESVRVARTLEAIEAAARDIAATGRSGHPG